MKAVLIFHEKLTSAHPTEYSLVVCEIKIWEINGSHQYPGNLKYSLFCVDKRSGKILVGYDNHFPKGHHKHINQGEINYDFVDLATLLSDFWKDIRKLGFLV